MATVLRQVLVAAVSGGITVGTAFQVLRGNRQSPPPVIFTEEERTLLNGNLGLFKPQEKALLRMLLDRGQAHVVAGWPKRGNHDDKKRSLMRQLCRLDSTYPGGLAAYLDNAKRLLQESSSGANVYEGYTPAIPEGITLSVTSGTGRLEYFEQLGLEAARDAAFVLVAGGLGERLGYSGIKIALPVETATNTCFLDFYIQSILALQEKSHAARAMPLAIMTSDDTHARTLHLLKKHKYFGADPEQIYLIKQEKVACIADVHGALALEDSDPYSVQTKPHGHGDVHALLHSSGLAQRWYAEGRKWVAFFQDTNALVFRGLLPTLGVSAEKGFDMNSLCVPRVAKEAIGVITTLHHTDGTSMTINVEYNQLDPLLRATTNPEGDVNDSTGHSPFPGNINQIVVKLSTYVEQLKVTKGVIAEFVNPKYRDATRTAFKKATRLECMMQDYPKGLKGDARVGFTTIKEVWAAYSPVKNSVQEALAKAAADSPTHSATSGELDIYAANCKLLQLVGAAIQAPEAVKFNGLDLQMYPRIVLSPQFMSSLRELRTRIPVVSTSLRVTTRSTLIIQGAGEVKLDGLDLDGTLILRTAKGTSLNLMGVTVRNQGWQWEPLAEDADAPEELKIRGFKVHKGHGCMIDVLAGRQTLQDRLLEADTVICLSGVAKPTESRKPWAKAML